MTREQGMVKSRGALRIVFPVPSGPSWYHFVGRGGRPSGALARSETRTKGRGLVGLWPGTKSDGPASAAHSSVTAEEGGERERERGEREGARKAGPWYA